MEKQYEQFCLANPVFYEHPHRDYDGQEQFPIASRPLPPGWRRARHGDWLVSIPPESALPQQGWKVHISACLENAGDIIATAWNYCVSREIHFKFLPSRVSVLMRNAKYAPRGSSGKAVTIYPRDEVAFERILGDLNCILGSAPGPYILSDLRYGSGPLYVRYGGFTERNCLDEHGALVPAIEDASGELVPDVRPPVFTVPPWVGLPDFLAPHLTARNSVTIEDLPYKVQQALHFSNGGGVYVATDSATGKRVILKEARPHAGLAADGSDAVTRLRRERDMLARLSGLGIAPEVHGYFEVGGHHFLAEEYIEGITLNSCYAERYPLTVPDPDPAAISAYTQWALHICAEVERSVTLMHERDVIFNDLHMFNIMIRPHDTVGFIDFEAATSTAEGRRLTVGNPGFVAPRNRAGFDVDRYSTACIRLAMFMPLTTLFTLDDRKAAQIGSVIAEHFPVPSPFIHEGVREIMGAGHRANGRPERDAATPAGDARDRGECDSEVQAYDLFRMGDQAWDPLRKAIVRAIRASATPSRDDRLFPGDIEQFTNPGGGLALAHGAAGVVYALSAAADLRVPEYEDWLIARTAVPAKGCKLGLYDGLAGIAYTLAHLGYIEAARRLASLCLDSRWEQLGTGLSDGLAGFALAMLALSDSIAEPDALNAALKAAEIVADRSSEDRNGKDKNGKDKTSRDGPAGLMRGASGPALMLIHLYERTGDSAYLDDAEAAIRADLARCVIDRKGSLQVNDGWRVLPYLNTGSVGIGMVIDRFLAHRQVASLTEAAAAIRIAARSAFYAQAGLFNGRAGMIAYLAGHDRRDPDVAAHVRRLAWHTVRFADGLAFPGDMLLRLSMDLGTGTAGVLLALAAALSPQGAALPFLEPPVSLPGNPSRGNASDPEPARR